MKFSDSLWNHIAPIYQSILDHPFNVQLKDGTLDHERFVFYMGQDAYYLARFCRALALIAGRSESSKIIQNFLNFAHAVFVVERELHAKFLPPKNEWEKIEPSPACVAYTEYLISKAATAPLEEAIAAILPCFWIYRDVGLNIYANVTSDNPYMSWINNYASQEFAEITNTAISLMDEVASQCNAEGLERMKNAFEYASLFEWHFWDDSYNMILFKNAYAAKPALSL